jgi:TonB family protein
MHSAVDKKDDEDEIAAQPASPKLRPPSAIPPTDNSRRREPRFALQPSDNPELIRLDKAEPAKSKHEVSQAAKAAPNQPEAEWRAAALASYQRRRQQTRLLLALLMLTLAGGGFYAAWTYQPGFRAIAQPQINRMLILGGVAPSPTPTSSLAKPSPHVAPPPVEPSVTLNIGKESAATPLGVQLPGESSAIVLSSKGAETRLAQSVPPKYPVEASSGEAEGTVLLKEVVDENGKVEGVRLIEGNATLATAAIKAVKKWRYRPYIRDGKAEPFQTVVIIDFQRP